MKKHLTAIILLFSFLNFFSQVIYEPRILILSPKENKYEKSFDKEIANYNKEIKSKYSKEKSDEILNSPNFKKQPENIQIITKSEIDYTANLDFFKQVSSMSEQYLAYKFYERFPNLLIKLKDATSIGTIDNLNLYSTNEQVQYVLNFLSIELYKENKISYAKIKVQLFDKISNSIIVEKEYSGDWYNPGLEFSCKDQTLSCTINNALSKALGEIYFTIASDNPTIKKERKLQQERFQVLRNNYLDEPFDKRTLEKIISPTDSNININIAYQALFSSDKNKFIAFFLEKVLSQDLKTIKDTKNDNHVDIISDKEENDPALFNSIPQQYAYIVYGVFYNNKWYYEKSNVTYFEARNMTEGKEKYFNNLQRWHFFNDGSIESNNEFWNTYFFSKIVSSTEKNKKQIDEYKSALSETTKKEEQDAYQSIINDYYEQDIKNKDYLGMYTVVADQFKKDKKEQDEMFAKKIRDQILETFYKRQVKKNGVEKFIKMNGEDFALIYPADKSILLSPILADYGHDKSELIYYVLIPNDKNGYDTYSWNYFKPIKPQYNSMYGKEINEQLNEVTRWNFSFETLEDKDFWNKYVLVKDGNGYKYLKQVTY